MSFWIPRPSARGRLALLSLFALSACAPLGAHTATAPTPTPIPSTVKGLVAFTPLDAATEVDPASPVTVRAAVGGASLRSVQVQDGTGADVPGVLKGGQFTIKSGLKPDSKYVVTAVASPKSGADDTETSGFSTATTPKVVSASPATIGDGQSVVLTLNPAASAVEVSGPVKSGLSPDGTALTVQPTEYAQGETFAFTLVAKNMKGIAGAPQASSFTSLPAANAGVYPNPGTSNLGVAVPLLLILSGTPADRADFVTHLSLTVDSKPPAAPAAGTPPAQNPCPQYVVPAVAGGDLPFTAVWSSARRLRLVPKTPDGYWPPNSTITLSAKISRVKTDAGNWFPSDITSTILTGDKRVIDVDLTSQTLTACRNGVPDNQFAISSGTPTHFTYTGNFAIYSRVADEEMKSPEGPFAPDYYDIKHVPWTQYFDGGAALHGAWWHNNFGHPMSHGCVNVQTPTDNVKYPGAKPQAEYLWNFDNIGDPVIVHGITPGLTAAQQLSD